MTAEAEIRRAVKEFVDAFNAGDMTRILGIITDDFIDMSAGGPTRTGQAAKEHFLSRVADMHTKFSPNLVVLIDEIQVTLDWAYQRGSLVVTLVPRAGGDTSHIRQRYLEIWRRGRDAKWRIAIEMDNSAES
jgi:ketosteroid isomerase-like protein